jgi:phenylpropionate dioxygenase-like ring-hydroxylating dioxygenase large terminal subunit
MTEQTQTPPADAHQTATRVHLGALTGDALSTWRIADDGGREDPDARNLQSEFPMGWYTVCYSDDLAPGQVKPARYFGQDLAIWRGEDGQPRVTGAYCAHYGANMAVGGVVHGNLLECPFHAWRWEGDGSCREIPYARVIPPQAKRPGCIPGWPVFEANGMVMVWYHSQGAPPQWEPVVFPEVGQEGWTPFRKYDWHVFTALENMADNAVDVSHFKFVHGATTVPEYEFKFDGITRRITSYLKLQTPRGVIDGKIESVNHGPGQGFVRFSGLSETILVTGTAPVERDKTHSRFAFTQPLGEADGPRGGLAKALVKDIVRQFDQDKVILDRHHRMEPPLVCDGDGPFGRNRAYYSQFYASQPPRMMGAA